MLLSLSLFSRLSCAGTALGLGNKLRVQRKCGDVTVRIILENPDGISTDVVSVGFVLVHFSLPCWCLDALRAKRKPACKHVCTHVCAVRMRVILFAFCCFYHLHLALYQLVVEVRSHPVCCNLATAMVAESDAEQW